MSTTSSFAGRAATLAAFTASLVGCALVGAYVEATSADVDARLAAARDDVERGAVRFLLDDLGGLSTETLETYAAPWKVVTTAVLAHAGDGAPFTQAGVATVFARWGFVVDGTIASWRGPGPPPALQRPLGLVSGTLPLGAGMSLDVVNDGCATCHASRGWDATGAPDRSIHLGLPSSSLDLESYASDVVRALRAASAEPPRAFVERVRALWPDASPGELRAIEHIVLPRIKARIDELGARDAFVPYTIGAPGLTNGVGAVKLQLGLFDGADVDEVRAREVGFTSIPDLSYRGLRSSLLADGLYAPKGARRFRPMRASDVDAAHVAAMGAIPAAFLLGTEGVRPHRAHAQTAAAREVFAYVTTVRAPPFPGPIEEERAAAGGALFAARCASCHGTYDATTRPATLTSFPNALVPLSVIGTDPARAASVRDGFAERVRSGPFGDQVDAQAQDGYVAPILAGVWATAPYLHNGSVPTLHDLLRPAARPARFPVGGHRLDFARMGIDLVDDDGGEKTYPPGYAPWSRPRVYDTSLPGRSNRGHEAQVAGLTDDDVAALIEHMKTF